MNRLGVPAVITASVLTLLTSLHQLRTNSFFEIAAVLGAVFIAHAAPIAVAREKQVSFTPAVVFAASLLVSGAAAGLSALLVSSSFAYFQRRNRRLAVMFSGAQQCLSALSASFAYSWLAGESGNRAFYWLHVVGAAGMFLLVRGALSAAAGGVGERSADPALRRSLLQIELPAYAVSFSLAGALVVAFPTIRHLGLLTLAGSLALCAYAARLTFENRLLRRQILSVEKLGRACASEVRVEAPLKQFLSLARDLIDFDRAIIWTIDEQSADLRPGASFPDSAVAPEGLEEGQETILGRVAERTEPMITSNTWADPFRERDRQEDSWLLYPLTHFGRPLGVAQFIRSGQRPFTKPEAARLAALVPQVTVAFESVRLRHEMFRFRDKAVTDSLTGLLNHQASKNQVRLEVERAQRYFRSVSILMLDVDAFKEFNDSYGHPQGDVLLMSLARILRSSVRTVDHVGRYGGEEFIIVLPETNRADAQVLAERIRATIAAQWFPVGDGQEVQRTVSIGVAGHPDDAIDPEELIQHADDALYRAKRAGRNCVLMA